jgi:hypothetical protein
MGKLKWIIAVVVIVVVVSAICVQHEQNRALAEELARTLDEKLRLQSHESAPNPEPAQDEGQTKQVGEVESELVRLRGTANRLARTEAENAQLKQEVERLRAQANGSANSTSQNSDALLAYLGPAVEAPSNLDPAYTRDGLSSAIESAAQKAGIGLKRVGIDDSEFPNLIGVTSEPGDWEKLKAQFKGMDAYEYHGSVGDDTVHTFSIVPTRAFPPGALQQVTRRLNVRMQLYYDTFSAQQN